MTINKTVRLILIVAIGVLLSKAVANYDKLLPHRWQTYTAPDGAFLVDLPGKFAVETLNTPVEGSAPVAIQFISAQPTKSTDYTCSYVDNQSDPQRSPQQILESARDGSLKKTQGVLISQKELMIQGYPALDMQAHARGNSLVDTRLILVNGRLYMLMAVATVEGDREPKTIRRLFDSFRILKKP
jgi:hypothetical protein